MGRSYTYHVIGFSNWSKDIRAECNCMNKMEMAQEHKKMADNNTPIYGWYAQTKTGCRMIGADYPHQEISDTQVSHCRLAQCPVCRGSGGNLNHEFRHPCVVCNGSGITKPGHWNKWSQWQIDRMKAEFGS